MDILDPRSEDPSVLAELLAWLALQRAFAFSPERLPAAIRTTEDPQRLLREMRLPPLPQEESRRLPALLAERGVRALPIASPLYPPRLLRLSDAPPLLLVRGTAELLHARTVSVVGARAATGYGLSVAREVATALAEAGFVVVSGLARGIDAAAHRAALAASGATVAFQACGPERVYPASHRRLADEVAGFGAVVTELPVGTPPRAPYFPLRNRLISAISEALVVVEARIRSGSLTTARHAAEQGVEVFAVPGPIHRPTSEGPHQLLRDGASLLGGKGDLLQALGVSEAPAKSLPGSSASASSASTAGAGVRAAPQDPLLRRVLEALSRESRSEEALARDLELDAGAVAGALARLEIEGHALQDRDGCWMPRLSLASSA